MRSERGAKRQPDSVSDEYDRGTYLALTLFVDFPFSLIAGSDGNSDFCMICGLGGDLILCDGCPNVAHVGCIKELEDVGDDEEWFCAGCKFQTKKSSGLSKTSGREKEEHGNKLRSVGV